MAWTDVDSSRLYWDRVWVSHSKQRHNKAKMALTRTSCGHESSTTTTRTTTAITGSRIVDLLSPARRPPGKELPGLDDTDANANANAYRREEVEVEVEVKNKHKDEDQCACSRACRINNRNHDYEDLFVDEVASGTDSHAHTGASSPSLPFDSLLAVTNNHGFLTLATPPRATTAYPNPRETQPAQRPSSATDASPNAPLSPSPTTAVCTAAPSVSVPPPSSHISIPVEQADPQEIETLWRGRL